MSSGDGQASARLLREEADAPTGKDGSADPDVTMPTLRRLLATNRRHIAWLGLAALLLVLSWAGPVWSRATSPPAMLGPLSVRNFPDRPWIERDERGLRLNFDLIIHNRTTLYLQLARIVAKVYDHKGRLVLQREINNNGSPPALSIVGGLQLGPSADVDIFQPFAELPFDLDLERMDLEVLFAPQGAPVPPILLSSPYAAHISVVPRTGHFEPWCLPMQGRLLVQDGHDLLSHHRRRDLVLHRAIDPTQTANTNLYAIDFIRVGDDGSWLNGAAGEVKSWRSYGQPVFAPMDATIVKRVDGVPDNHFEHGLPIVPKPTEAIDPDGLGNHVALRGRDGRVAWLLHLRPGSLRGALGEQIRAGTQVGEVGFSGDALFPHLHYMVTADARYPSQPIPSWFRRGGRGSSGNRSRFLETGEIIESHVNGRFPNERSCPAPKLAADKTARSGRENPARPR